MGNSIVESCEDLRAVGHRVLCVQVLRVDGRWIGRIGLGLVPAGGLGAPRCPAGVTCRAMVAPADIDVPLPRGTSEEGAEYILEEVARAGRAIDWARFAREDGQISYLCKPLAWGRPGGAAEAEWIGSAPEQIFDGE